MNRQAPLFNAHPPTPRRGCVDAYQPLKRRCDAQDFPLRAQPILLKSSIGDAQKSFVSVDCVNLHQPQSAINDAFDTN